MLDSRQRLIGISFMAVVALVAQDIAQGGATGAIAGTVQDASSAFIANGEVKITNQDTRLLERTVRTDASGSFTTPLLPVGTYTVSVKSSGFADASFSNIVVRVTETTRLIATLTPSAVQQKVEVKALVQAADTTDSTTRQAIEPSTILSPPPATQNFQPPFTLSTAHQSQLNQASQ